MPAAGLPIRHDACELDFLAVGASCTGSIRAWFHFARRDRSTFMYRAASTTPRPDWPIVSAMNAGIATAMVRYGIGDLVQARVRETGVVPFYKWFDHDGVRGPNIATVYSDRGQGVRPPVVFYNRANEAGALLKPGDFDWAGIFKRGVRWFHSGGIFARIVGLNRRSDCRSDAGGESRRARHFVRPQLSAEALGRDRRHRKARHVFKRIVGYVDALIGNEEDLQSGLGIAGPDVAAKSSLDPDTFFMMIDRAVERHPNIKLVATTLREVHSANRHDWAAVLWLNGRKSVEPDVPPRRHRPNRRRRRLLVGPDLRLAHWPAAGRSLAARLGARRAADDLSR